MLQNIWKRQSKLTQIYNIANDITNIEALFHYYPDKTLLVMILAIQKRAASVIAEIENDRRIVLDKKKEMIETKNAADSLIFTAEKTLKDAGDKADSSLKKEVEDKIADLKSVLETGTKEDLEKNKDKALFDYNYTKMKAVYCYTKQKHPVVEAEISDLLLMGALGLGASAGTLAFGGAPAIALAAGGIGLATAGMKDAVVSDKNYVAIASLQQAKTSQLSEYYKASGYNTALAGLDVVLMPLDGIPLAKKAITSIQGNKKLTKVKSLTSSIDNLDPADQMLVAQIYDTIKINIGKADPIMKQLLEETETNKETRELMLLVVDKLKRDMEAKRKVSGVSVQEIQDDLAKKLNSCLARKEGKFPLSDIKPMK